MTNTAGCDDGVDVGKIVLCTQTNLLHISALQIVHVDKAETPSCYVRAALNISTELLLLHTQ